MCKCALCPHTAKTVDNIGNGRHQAKSCLVLFAIFDERAHFATRHKYTRRMINAHILRIRTMRTKIHMTRAAYSVFMCVCAAPNSIYFLVT